CSVAPRTLLSFPTRRSSDLIGLELAKSLARRGYDLVLNAEDAELDGAADAVRQEGAQVTAVRADLRQAAGVDEVHDAIRADGRRSEEHTSELQSLAYLVCRL